MHRIDIRYGKNYKKADCIENKKKSLKLRLSIFINALCL